MKLIIFTILISFSLFNSSNSSSCLNLPMVTRREWAARSPAEITYQTIPVKYVLIHHTVSQKCTTKAQCSEYVANIQAYHIDTNDYDDIGYNYLIGNDGNVYEGCGWNKVGAHVRGYNTKSLGIAFIGNFSNEKPTRKAMRAAKQLLACGVELGKLDKNYRLLGALQVSATKSPGLALYNEIQKFEHWVENP